MALWGLGIVVAPIFGPVLGGWLTDNYSWRWVFYINIPIGIAGVDDDPALCFRSRIHPPRTRRESTYWGLGLMIVGIGALQVVLDQGQEEDWLASHWITTMVVVAAIALMALTDPRDCCALPDH